MRNKLASMLGATLVVAGMLLALAAPVSAASTTACQDQEPPFTLPQGRFAAAYSHRTATEQQAVRGRLFIEAAGPALGLCSDPNNSDTYSASTDWIGVRSTGISEIIQAGIGHCYGCGYTTSNTDSNGNPLTPLPDASDGKIYLWYSWGGKPFDDGPIGQGPSPVAFTYWSGGCTNCGTLTPVSLNTPVGCCPPRVAIWRDCPLTPSPPIVKDCSDHSKNWWWIAWSQDDSDPVAALNSGCCVSSAHGWVQVLEDKIPWSYSEDTTTIAACEQFDRGDACGGPYQPAGGALTAVTDMQSKDWTATPPASTASWVNPKANNGGCDRIDQPTYMVCNVMTSSGGNPDNRLQTVQLETADNR